jgi:hypothetical protein
MSEALGEPQEIKTDEHKDKYFNFQIKGWTNFEPMGATLARIAEGIEEGGGFLTLVEVLQVEEDLASIGDAEVRECFANVLAAKRLVRNVRELPKHLFDELRSVLNSHDEVVPKKTVAPAAISAVSADSGFGAKRRP